ncbi:hypothetical protein RN001_007935 [Aquatica leii]|uniref:RWD domain-containing protein n=1 Tax=Aquatica leii TaxID=1421715 RepID=A0AAN7P9L2_9COLE|nr:hypothetical protein RN001_007935 [Aquatica leii]
MAVRWSSEFFTALEHRELQASAMAVDSTGTFVLLAGRRYIAVRNLDDTDFENIRKFPRQSKYDVNTAEWNPTQQNSELCVISSNQHIEILKWSLGELTQTHSMRAHTRVITDLNWHKSDPNVLASCSIDTFIHIWDMRDFRKPSLSLSAIAEASQVRWNQVSPHILATAHDGDIKVWDQRKGNAPIQYITAHLSKINGLDWNPQIENQLATASQDNTVKFFDINNPRRVEFVLVSNAPVWRARFTPFGNGLVTVVVPQLRRGENSLLLWNTNSRSAPVHTFVGHKDVVLEFQWRKQKLGENDFQLVTWSRDQTLLVWRIEPFLQKLCGYDPNNCRKLDGVENEVSDTASEVSYKAVTKIKPLQQEFSLLNVQIPNLKVVKMDASQRCCVVSANANNYKVTLHVNFPNGYPNGIPPVFEIGQGSSIDEFVSKHLLQSLTYIAQQRVSKGRTCLEPCLRQFVVMLEQLVDSSDVTQLHQHQYLEPDVLGTFNDACIPFPRTSGAKFCSVSILVCFGRQLHMRRTLAKVDSSTPRALSALGNGFNNRRGNEQLTVISHYIQKQRLRIKQSNRSLKGVITVYDAAGLFSVNRQLAEKYILDGDVTRICKYNAKIAEFVGRWDLVQAWTLAGLVIKTQEVEQEDMMEHPFGNQLIQSLITHYANHSDLQTAAMLSCVFGKGQDEKARRKSLLKYFSVGTGSPYHTIPPADVVADGWVFPLLRAVRSNSLDNLRVEELPQLIPQKPPVSAFYEYYKLAYAEMLHRWGLLYNRAEILKYLCTPAEIHRGVEFLTDCQKCKEPSRTTSCPTCKRISLECIICHISVKGSANCCLVCGHGGHTKHIQQWFERYNVCATGCGCKCLIETVGMFNF